MYIYIEDMMKCDISPSKKDNSCIYTILWGMFFCGLVVSTKSTNIEPSLAIMIPHYVQILLIGETISLIKMFLKKVLSMLQTKDHYNVLLVERLIRIINLACQHGMYFVRVLTWQLNSVLVVLYFSIWINTWYETWLGSFPMWNS